MATEKITIKLVLDSSGYKRGAQQASTATDQIKGKVNQTNSTFGKLGGTLGKVGGALVGVFAAKKIFQAASAAIGRAEAMASAYAITEKVIEQTGGAANVTADQIKRLSKEQSLLTGVDKELITQSNNVLLTFKNIRNEVGEGNDIFDQASGLILDMSTVMGTDAKSGAIQLGKALNDPIMGVTALNRVGITFTAQQKEQITALTESGDVLGAQTIILAELEGQLGGTAEAAADTTAKIGNAFKEVQESIGSVLLDALDDIAPELINIAESAEGMAPLFAGAAKIIVAALKPIVGWLVLVADGVVAITSLWDESARAALRYKEAEKQVRDAQPSEEEVSFWDRQVKDIILGTDAIQSAQAVYDAFADGIQHLAISGAITTDNILELAAAAELSEGAMAGALAVNLEAARANHLSAESIEVLEDALLSSIGATGESSEKQAELIDKYGLADAAARGLAAAEEGVGDAAGGATGEVDEFGNAIEESGDEAADAESALKSYLDLLAGLVNPALKAVNSLGDLQEAVAKVAELEAEGKTDTDEYRLAQLELAAQVFETEAALREFDGGNVEQSVLAIAEALDIDAQAARELLEELGLIDGTTVRSVVDTRFTQSGTPAAIRAAGTGDSAVGTGRQHGGPVETGMPVLVGEAGPEIFIPDSAGQIVSNADAIKGAGTAIGAGDMGGDVNLVINNPVAENVEDDTRRGIQTAGFLRGAN